MKINFKVNNRTREFLVIVLLLLIFEISVIARYHIKLEVPYYILTFASISIIPSLILFFKSSKVRYIIYSIFMFICLATFITNTCLFYYKGDIFSLGMIFDIGDGMRMGIKYNIFIAFDLLYWIFIFSAIILGMAYIGHISLGKNKTITKIKLKYNFISVVCLFVVLFGSLFVREIDKQTYKTPQDKRTYLLTFGISTFNQRDAITTFSRVIGKTYLKAKASQELITIDIKPAKQTKANSSFAGKNVIMIMMETVEQYAIDKKLTPTLYKLLNDAYSFTNAYGVAKTNNTYDAEFKSLTSMMYYNPDNFMYSYDDNEFTNALPNVLKYNGYTTNSFHSNMRTYFNRENMHNALGFDHYYADESMTFSPYDGFPLDSELFDQMKDLIAPVQTKPFFSFVITYSTHGPYLNDVNDRKGEFTEYYKIIDADSRYKDHEEAFKNLLAAQMNLDKGLEILINDLKTKGLLEDTLLVLFSDHKNYSNTEITEKYSNVTIEEDEYNYEIDKVPFSIYNPNIEKRQIDYVTSQYDITPTILDLLGIEYVEEFYYGQSVFLYDTDDYVKKPIIMGYNRWIDDKMIVYDKDILYYDESLENVDEYYLQMQSQVFQTIQKFHNFFLTDYFRKTAIN